MRIYTNRPNFSSSPRAALSQYLYKACQSFSSLPHMLPHLPLLEQTRPLPFCLPMLWSLTYSLWHLILRSFLPRDGIPHLLPPMRPHLYQFSQPRRRDSPQPYQNNIFSLNLNRPHTTAEAPESTAIDPFQNNTAFAVPEAGSPTLPFPPFHHG